MREQALKVAGCVKRSVTNNAKQLKFGGLQKGPLCENASVSGSFIFILVANCYAGSLNAGCWKLCEEEE